MQNTQLDNQRQRLLHSMNRLRFTFPDVDVDINFENNKWGWSMEGVTSYGVTTTGDHTIVACRVDAGFSTEEHIHTGFLERFIVISGTLTLSLNGKEKDYHQGTGRSIYPHDIHSTKFNVDTTLVIYYEPSLEVINDEPRSGGAGSQPVI